jgi:putative ABC transport system permease protein
MTNVLDNLAQDVRYGARAFARTPGFTLIAVLTLGLGIGANTAIFSVVNAVLLRPLPYKDANRLVRIFGSVAPTDNPNGPARRVPGVQVADVAPLRARTQTLSHIAFYLPLQATMTGRDEIVRLEGSRISSEGLAMVGAQPILGRLFEPKEEASGADTVVLLSHATWRRYFGAAPTALGQSLTLDGRAYSVIGVMPEDFRFPDAQVRFWIPFVATDFPRMGGAPIARLKDGVTIEAATAEVSSLLPQVRAAQPVVPGPQGPPPPSRYELVGLQEMLVAPIRPALLVLTGAVGFVLLIACVNVANLLLARTAARQREMAVRLALGAGRARLARQALTESVLLALAGGVVGVALAFGGIYLLQTLATGLPRRDMGPGVTLPRLDEIGMDGSVLAFSAAASVLTGLVFGLAPALRRSRSSPMDTLREGAGSVASGFNLFRQNRTQGLLVVAEIGMAVMLFVGGGLLIASFLKLSHVDPGFDSTGVVTAQVTWPRGRYDGPQLARLADDIVARLERVPGVRVAGYARQLPTVQMRQITLLRTTPDMPARIPAPPPFDGRQLPETPDTRVVSRGFLTVMGIRVVAGRGFGDNDRAGQPQAMLINRTMARSGFLGEHPIGKQIYGPGRQPWEVVGIVDDVRQFGLDRDPDPQVFVDFRQEPPPPNVNRGAGPPPVLYFAARAMGHPFAAVPAIRDIVRQVDPMAVVENVATMDQIVSNSLSRPRLYAVLLGVFAGIAVALAAIGIYGVMAYSVAQRTREIGIRMALGAQRAQVVRLVLGQGIALTAIGTVVGLCTAAAITRYLRTMLFGLTPLDPSTFAAVALLFSVVAIVASYVPARHATRVDPLVALRCD